MNETEAMSYLAEIIDAARAGGAPREHIQALQLAREALDADTGFTPVSPEEVSKMQKELAQTRQYLREALDTAYEIALTGVVSALAANKLYKLSTREEDDT